MKKLLLFAVLLSFFVISCSKDDLVENDPFFDGALTSATSQNLLGKWAIFQIVYNNNTYDVPINIQECGRDFINFQPNNEYREYLFSSNNCIPQVNLYSWNLSNGIITLQNGNLTDKWVITELTTERMVFKFKMDIDSDTKLDVVQAICYRYNPPAEFDIYSETFRWGFTDENLDKITLKWDAYIGYNEFVKYEIYRLEENCGTTNPILIATITNKQQSTFIDETPPPYQEICYVFKIYTNQGLLGESSPVTVDTSRILVPNIQLAVPILSGNNVQLNWQQFQGYYFSHYEIEVRNYSYGYGNGFQKEQLGIINNKTNTTFTSPLPYFNNPVFVIHVYNIFGYRNSTVVENQNQRSTNFINNEILPINHINFLDFSPTETVLYYCDLAKLYRYNYVTHTVENNTTINSSSIVFLKTFQSAYGTEVIINRGSEIKVYDKNLNFKYNLETTSVSPDNLELSDNGYWLIADRQKLYSFSRSNNILTLINSNNLYNENFCCTNINIKNIGQNTIVVGNATKNNGLKIGINSNGELTSSALPVALNMTNGSSGIKALFSPDNQYLLDVESKNLYSTSNYNLITSLNQDFFPSGISNNGSLILGTKNNPNGLTEYFHEKKVRTIAYPSYNEQIYNSKGYPMVVHQNHLGQIISVSKGLIGSLNQTTPENDIFIEVIN